jgi:hypothetical protein
MTACGAGYDEGGEGWVGVTCDGMYWPGAATTGRVVSVYGFSVGGELLPFFGRLGALRRLELGGNSVLRGNVADLAGATELRELKLYGSPLVMGDVGALAAHHPHLQGTKGGPSQTDAFHTALVSCLAFAGSGVHGPVATLRALPGISDDWGRRERLHSANDFTPCSSFPGCAAAGLVAVQDAADVAGSDECACCEDSPLVRQASGLCGMDCAGSWSGCNANCQRVWTETVARIGAHSFPLSCLVSL